jgi:hypothetical protein
MQLASEIGLDTAGRIDHRRPAKGRRRSAAANEHSADVDPFLI